MELFFAVVSVNITFFVDNKIATNILWGKMSESLKTFLIFLTENGKSESYLKTQETFLQWNPVNTTTIGPKYFGRNNGVVVLTGVRIKLQSYVFNDVIRN